MAASIATSHCGWNGMSSCGKPSRPGRLRKRGQPIGDRPRRCSKECALARAVIEGAVAFGAFGFGIIAMHATAPVVMPTEIALPARRIFATRAVAAPVTLCSMRLFDSDARIIPAKPFVGRAHS